MATGPVSVVDVSKSPNLLPSAVTLPSALGAVLWCVNHILPSGPAAIAPGSLGVGMTNSVRVMLGPGTAATLLGVPELEPPDDALPVSPELEPLSELPEVMDPLVEPEPALVEPEPTFDGPPDEASNPVDSPEVDVPELVPGVPLLLPTPLD
jgi:hypothetical protein